jgi:putative addiction module component (TIGR02574 family)
MTVVDIANLSPRERLELIGRLWDSLDDDDVPVTPARADELDRRLETADADLSESVSWESLRAELKARSAMRRPTTGI